VLLLVEFVSFFTLPSVSRFAPTELAAAAESRFSQSARLQRFAPSPRSAQPFTCEFLLNGPFYCVNHGV
jgi:hypothetical protein